MVPLFKCSATNLCISSFSFCVRGRSLPGRVDGAFGRSSIAWSHMVCRGNLCDDSSLNTFLCHWYSGGIIPVLGSCFCSAGWIVTLPMKYRFWSIGRGWFSFLERNLAFPASLALKIMGRWDWSIHPFFQSMRGWTAANHGYPSIAFCPPRSERKKWRLVTLVPVHAPRSTKNWTSPALFSVPSTLYSFRGFVIFLMGNFIHRAYVRSMKFLVAPESKRAIASALFATECR